MSTLHRFPDRADAQKEAGAWIARLHADDVTPDDLERFKDWCEAHPQHARLFEAMAGTIDEVKRAGRIVKAVNFGNAMNTATTYSEDRLRKRTGVREFFSQPRVFAAAAAVVMATIALAWWVQHSTTQTMFQTAIGERASVELPDGSRLDLNSQSTARVSYRNDARVIYLAHGEAYFNVAPDPARPFWVVAGKSSIRALGTAFNVDLRASGVRVTVSEGTVKVSATSPGAGETERERFSAEQGAVLLTVGQQVELKSGSTQIRPAAPGELTRLAAWRKGKLYFENQSLESVIDELSRYTDASITIEDPTLRQLPIGGTFQANPQGVEALLGLLQNGFGLRVRKDTDHHIFIENTHP